MVDMSWRRCNANVSELLHTGEECGVYVKN